MTINTSRKQVAACFKYLPQLAPNWRYANNILNFGAGKWPSLASDFLVNTFNQVMTVTHYDPNSEDEAVNTELESITDRRFCVTVCANVLNVCKDLDAVIADLAQVDFDCCVIQIYEGNRSGKGRKTRDGYQRNELVADYVPVIKQNFHRHDVVLHRGHKCITVTKGRKFYELDKREE